MGSFIIDTQNTHSFIIHFMDAPEYVECQYHDDDLLFVRYDNRNALNRKVGETGFNSIEQTIEFITYCKLQGFNVKVYYNDYTQFMNYDEPTDNDYYMHSYDFSIQYRILFNVNYLHETSIYGPFVENAKYDIVWRDNRPGFMFNIVGKTYWVPLYN